ncbi:MAG: NAD-dependent epimerase/dehydratase family protein [Dysgonamonadaceae bacterium]|jgi:nucleoside-diphosphate-sugar epimerase|nr:NAD-dependent epimerase/dehydratase family protein [Dysgonamonadaceae bacterium]
MYNPTILITGAAGNLGGLLANYLKDRNLYLLIHEKDVAPELKKQSNIHVFRADLKQKETLREPLKNVDTIVHFAGVLFKANPQKFLPETNTLYFNNLLDMAIEQQVKKIILISFPHVEGETTPQQPATGRLDGQPISVHARTRLQEEKDLFKKCGKAGITAISLRVGMVYGRGILMPNAAEWFGKRCLLGVWRKPTFIHLISKDDFLSAVTAAIDNPAANGIYHIGDDGVQTLQQFLDKMAEYKHFHKPWRMPLWMILTAAQIFEIFSFLFGTKSLLTKDFIKIGRVSYYGDTMRMKAELLPQLKYKTFEDGKEII